MTTETSKQFIRCYFDALRKDKSIATLNTFIADEELKQHIAMYESAFPGYWIEHQETIAEGDKVVVRGIVRGVHKGNLMNIPPTGKEVSFQLVITCRIADGKIVEHWMLADMLSLLQQVSALQV
jgi:predicted ester cyclase